MNIQNSLQYIPIILPTIIGYTASFFCKTSKDAGKNVYFRPDSKVFGIVWPILYLLIGLSWFYAKHHHVAKDVTNLEVDFFYVVLNVCLASWIIAYSCKRNKVQALYILIIAFTAALFVFSIGSVNSKLMISPLISWLLFAIILNAFDIQP